MEPVTERRTDHRCFRRTGVDSGAVAPRPDHGYLVASAGRGCPMLGTPCATPGWRGTSKRGRALHHTCGLRVAGLCPFQSAARGGVHAGVGRCRPEAANTLGYGGSSRPSRRRDIPVPVLMTYAFHSPFATILVGPDGHNRRPARDRASAAGPRAGNQRLARCPSPDPPSAPIPAASPCRRRGTPLRRWR